MNSVGDEGGRTGQFYGPHGIALSKDSKVFSQNGRSPSILKFCCTVFTRGLMSMWTMTLRMLLVGEINYNVSVFHISGTSSRGGAEEGQLEHQYRITPNQDGFLYD